MARRRRKPAVHRVLFATSEAHPLVKTGGLGDVSGSLPAALAALGHDIRIVLPAYRDALARAGDCRPLATLQLPRGVVRLLETRLPGSGVPVLLVDHPPAFDRPGNPYLGPAGDWPDNAFRFALFADAICAIARDQAGLGWKPDVLHANDWQTGLAPALLSRERARPGLVFTIHNLAYQGLFPPAAFTQLGLPREWWSWQALEFHGLLSFMKGGLVFADRLTTVSPTYAQEIQTPAYGQRLDGLLRHRSARLAGILNGIDEAAWNPAGDGFLEQDYDAATLERKAVNKLALQAELGLTQDAGVPLFGLVGRLVEQKGIDLVLAVLPDLLGAGAQCVLQGSGESGYEQALRAWSERQPRQIAARIVHDERLAHRIEAGADFFLMPSRFEPCGLNQMYSQRYGTLPVVRRTGGLADTVVHADAASLADGRANGIVFEDADPGGLRWAIGQALALYRRPADLRRAQLAAMSLDYSWRRAAVLYADSYAAALADRAAP